MTLEEWYLCTHPTHWNKLWPLKKGEVSADVRAGWESRDKMAYYEKVYPDPQHVGLATAKNNMMEALKAKSVPKMIFGKNMKTGKLWALGCEGVANWLSLLQDAAYQAKIVRESPDASMEDIKLFIVRLARELNAEKEAEEEDDDGGSSPNAVSESEDDAGDRLRPTSAHAHP